MEEDKVLFSVGELEFTADWVDGVLCTALDTSGYSRKWIAQYKFPEGDDRATQTKIPLCDRITAVVCEGKDFGLLAHETGWTTLNIVALQRGMEKYIDYLKDTHDGQEEEQDVSGLTYAGNIDAPMADTILQYSVLGEEMFS